MNLMSGRRSALWTLPLLPSHEAFALDAAAVPHISSGRGPASSDPWLGLNLICGIILFLVFCKFFIRSGKR